MTVSVYVAASGATIERRRVVAVITALRGAGFRVTSTWVETIDANGGVSNPVDATALQREAWSVGDLAQVTAADVLWFLVPGATVTRGAWVELGHANAHGKHIVCSGPSTSQSIFCALGEEFSDDASALEHLIAWAADHPSASCECTAYPPEHSGFCPGRIAATPFPIAAAPGVMVEFETIDEDDVAW